MDDGRSNIVVLGLCRYKLKGLVESGDPYYVGDVAYFEDDAPSGDIDSKVSELKAIFQRVVNAAFDAGNSRSEPPDLDDLDPERLSFIVPAALGFDNEFKYRMLHMTDTAERIDMLTKILNSTIDTMEESIKIHKAAGTNGHSKKKVDL